MNRLFLFLILILIACNPFPKKDTHPDTPFLEDLLKDKSKFEKVLSTENLAEVIFLQDDRILTKPNNSQLPFKILDVHNKVYFSKAGDWKMPFYIDKSGNLYLNQQKYFYPDYQRHEAFKTVVFKDSLDKKSEQLGNQYPDSVELKILAEFEVNLLKPYHLQPCPYTLVNTERCDVFEIINNTLVVRQTELFKNDFSKQSTEPGKFDDDVLIRWDNGRMPNPIYLAYYQLNKHQFKCDDQTAPKTIHLKGKQYLFTYKFGLYLVK